MLMAPLSSGRNIRALGRGADGQVGPVARQQAVEERGGVGIDVDEREARTPHAEPGLVQAVLDGP